MANIKSQIKRNRQTLKRQERNKGVRSKMRTQVKSVVAAANEGDADVEVKLRAAVKQIDKAANKGIIHKNTAARKKSRLMKQLNQMQG